MKKNKHLIKIGLLIFVIIYGIVIFYKISTPVLNNNDIKEFKKELTAEYEYINKIKFYYHEGGLEIKFHTKAVSDDEVNEILNATQEFVSTKTFIDNFSQKYRNKYQNITRHYPADYAPPANIVIYEDKTPVPRCTYISAPPYDNWNLGN